ncbi:MAG: hypothetical protein WCS94_18095, partial [Verrucomicrobiota bacterium]
MAACSTCNTQSTNASATTIAHKGNATNHKIAKARIGKVQISSRSRSIHSNGGVGGARLALNCQAVVFGAVEIEIAGVIPGRQVNVVVRPVRRRTGEGILQ